MTEDELLKAVKQTYTRELLNGGVAQIAKTAAAQIKIDTSTFTPVQINHIAQLMATLQRLSFTHGEISTYGELGLCPKEAYEKATVQ